MRCDAFLFQSDSGTVHGLPWGPVHVVWSSPLIQVLTTAMLGLSDKNVGVAPLCSRLTPSLTETADDPTWSYLQEKAYQGIDPADCRPRLQVYDACARNFT